MKAFHWRRWRIELFFLVRNVLSIFLESFPSNGEKCKNALAPNKKIWENSLQPYTTWNIFFEAFQYVFSIFTRQMSKNKVKNEKFIFIKKSARKSVIWGNSKIIISLISSSKSKQFPSVWISQKVEIFSVESVQWEKRVKIYIFLKCLKCISIDLDTEKKRQVNINKLFTKVGT